MSEDKNGARPGETPSGGFRVHIDEKELAGGAYRPQAAQARPSRSAQPAGNTGYYSADGDSREERRAHKKRNRLKARKNKRVFAVVWLCMVALVALTIASYLIGGVRDFFAVGRMEGSTEVELTEETEPDSLAQLLYQRGAINKPEFFQLYAKVTVDDWTYFKKGVYQIDTNLDYEDILNRLQGGNESREEVRITFPEGSTALEIASLLEENGVCTQGEFLAALNEDDFTNYDVIAAMPSAAGKYFKIEGYLFPDTYDFWKGEEVDSVIGKMLNNFQNKMTDTLLAQVQQSGYTLDQIVTIASIIQAEAADLTDMYNVSAVIHNRLSYGPEVGIYRLECDSTSFYPYKRQSDIPAEGAMAYGAYDTYVVEGLPAGAICDPGLDAIQAALRPNTEGDAPYYLYFCHAADGTAYYATNKNDHAYNLYLAGLTDDVYYDSGDEWGDEW